MDIIEAMKIRHAVRSYTDKKIEGDVLEKLQGYINECNEKSGLNIQLCLDEPKAFDGFLAHYGSSFKNVKNYIAVVGKKGKGLEEKCGYWGEKIVLYATQLGLASCWVGGTFSKGKCTCKIADKEKLYCVIAVGYGETAGTAHKSKSIEALSKVNEKMPDWFRNGMEAALLAPTAVNQQKFMITLDGNTVTAKEGIGLCTKLGLGIVKCHFEIGAKNNNWKWG